MLAAGTATLRSLLAAALLLLFLPTARAQDNYEIQVYGSDTVPAHHTMLELHSNYTLQGSRTAVDGVYPTQDQLHETIEITHGFTDWFETGFYIFTSFQHSQGYQWVGDHIRPRVRVPESWKWPVGVSLSMEVGYQRPEFSSDIWTLEIRPIVDKQLGKWYLAFNPTLDKSLSGATASQGYIFSPNFTVGYDVNRKLNVALEYYGSVGPVFDWYPQRDQQQQIVPAINLNFGPDWEFNFGVPIGLTSGTDTLLVKMIIGRRFDF